MLYPDTTHRLETVFEHGRLPTLVYINKQNHTRKAIRRPLHRHDSICELLFVYQGTGTYYVNGKSYPLSEGSVIYYNQGDLHEVISETEHEIGDYCIGISNLRRCDLRSPRQNMRSEITVSVSLTSAGVICLRDV